MKRNDPRAQYVLTLECGHQRPGPSSAGAKRCRDCGQMKGVVSVGELIRQERKAPPETRVDSLSTGLMVRHIIGRPQKIWWCRICDGKKPSEPFRRVTHSMDDVTAGWDAHASSEGHRQHVSDQDRVAAIFSAKG